MPVSTFSLKVIASDKVFFEGRCQSLVVPAHDGEKGILPHHEEMVMAVREGTVRIRLEDGAILYAVIGIGFVHVANNRVILLVDTAERPEDIDRKRAEEAKERAEEQLELNSYEPVCGKRNGSDAQSAAASQPHLSGNYRSDQRKWLWLWTGVYGWIFDSKRNPDSGGDGA